MLENTVGKGRSENGSEIIVQRAEKGQVRFFVVADAENIVRRGTKPSVHFAVVVFAAAARIRVVRIGMRTTDKGGEPRGRDSLTFVIEVSQSGLTPIGSW